MYNFLITQYGLEKETELKVSSSVTKIKTKNGYYLIKEIQDSSLENLFQRLNLIDISSFLLPIKGRNNLYIQEEDDKYFVIYKFLKEETLAAIDLKLDFYINAISDLHKKTKIKIKATDHYLESTLNYLDNEIKKISDALEARIEVVERSDYHSPNDWYFLMNYHLMQEALESASRHVLNFEQSVKEIDSFSICLTYQNFDFDHILLKNHKIVSVEKMAYNFSGTDLYHLLKKMRLNSIKIEPYIEQYLKQNPLEEYEKEYLMAMLYIFDYHRFESFKDDIFHLVDIVNYIQTIQNIEDNVIFSSPSKE